jgi:hypothetical protein
VFANLEESRISARGDKLLDEFVVSIESEQCWLGGRLISVLDVLAKSEETLAPRAVS